jgi:hypothetical protein
MARTPKTPRKRIALPSWPTSPPLTNITALSSLVMTPPWQYQLTEPEGSAWHALENFLGGPLPPDFDVRPYGNVQDFIDAHHNVTLGSFLVERMLADLVKVCAERKVPPNPRLLVSARLVSLGVSQVTAAHVLHIRPHKFYQTSALALLRTGIELIGRGGWVATGTGDEPHRVTEGHKLTRGQRLELQKTDGASFCLAQISPTVQRRWRDADPPVQVYEWLCQFTHFDGSVVEQLAADDGSKLREYVYAASAYVACIGAIIAELIIGMRGARLPRLPPTPPWRAQ